MPPLALTLYVTQTRFGYTAKARPCINTSGVHLTDLTGSGDTMLIAIETLLARATPPLQLRNFKGGHPKPNEPLTSIYYIDARPL